MKMTLPQFILTLKSHSTGNLTRVDNVFCSESLLNSIVKCYVNAKNRPAKTDHFPVITEIDTLVPKAEREERQNMKEAEWDDMLEFIHTKLSGQPHPAPITSTADMDKKIKFLDDMVQEAIKKFVPLTKITPYTKRWWMKDLLHMRWEMKKLGAKSDKMKLNFTHPIHEEYRTFQNGYADAIEKAKAAHWANWLGNISDKDIWKAKQIITGLPSDTGKVMSTHTNAQGPYMGRNNYRSSRQ